MLNKQVNGKQTQACDNTHVCIVSTYNIAKLCTQKTKE